MISVIIPAHNEEATIEGTLVGLRSLTNLGEIIVVDDGSQDQTARIARACGAHVLSLRRKQGKAGALRRGFEVAGGDSILFCDADLGMTAKHLSALCSFDLVNDCDMAVARLPGGRRRGGFGLVVGLAERAIRRAGGNLTSPLSGQRLVRRELLATLPDWGSGFGIELALSLHALRSGCRIVEIELPLQHRVTGWSWSGVLHRARQYRDLLVTLKRIDRVRFHDAQEPVSKRPTGVR